MEKILVLELVKNPAGEVVNKIPTEFDVRRWNRGIELENSRRAQRGLPPMPKDGPFRLPWGQNEYQFISMANMKTDKERIAELEAKLEKLNPKVDLMVKEFGSVKDAREFLIEEIGGLTFNDLKSKAQINAIAEANGFEFIYD